MPSSFMLATGREKPKRAGIYSRVQLNTLWQQPSGKLSRSREGCFESEDTGTRSVARRKLFTFTSDIFGSPTICE